MKNIFELAEEEKLKKTLRSIAMERLCQRNHNRGFIASQLYEATYQGGWNPKEPQEVLDVFCQNVFGAPYQEVIDWYDNYLG